jgi:UDP-N-acetyl-D-mannosaminuronic acid dehydrogenase
VTVTHAAASWKIWFRESMSFRRICIIGLGYVGLPTAATLAARGVEVIGVDIRKEVVDRINSGQAHFAEPDLDIILRSAVMSSSLRAVTEPESADAFLIAVPTPTDRRWRADLSAVEDAVTKLAPLLKTGDLVVIESTSPVGTTKNAARLVKKLRPELTNPLERVETSDLMFAYCPERILPGQTLRELIDNARVIGGLDKRSALRAKELYNLFVRGEIVLAAAEEAELSKLAENAYRDVNIAYANELSLVCDKLKVNVWNVIRIANKHPRVRILAPGPGVGGHCIPVDPWFIHQAVPEQTPLIRVAREVNGGKTRIVAARILAHSERFCEPSIAILGLAYKPDVDDLRESPAVQITLELAKRANIALRVVEPHVKRLPAELAGKTNVRLCDLREALDHSDVIAILVAHTAFRAIEPSKVAKQCVIDAVGLFTDAQH